MPPRFSDAWDNLAMCGRFSLATAGPIVAEIFAIDDPDPAVMADWRARYNIAPSQPAIVIRAAGDGKRQLGMLRWGLIPRWAKDPKAGPAPINARADTVAAKPMFKGLLARRRCIVPADGFYEWKTEGRKKLPVYFQMRDRRPFGLAGLWEQWKGGDQTIESFTLLTTEPNDLVETVHDRMPAILPPEAYSEWLDPGLSDSERLLSLLGPFPADRMTAVPVGTRVNSPAFDDPACIEPAGQQGSLLPMIDPRSAL